MKAYTENNVYLGNIEYNKDNDMYTLNRSGTIFTEYMLEQALKMIKRVKNEK